MSANVSALHVAKNIVLKRGYSPSFVIKELLKVNLTKRLDLTKTSFRNEGESLQYYSNAHSLVIYDKIQDLNQSRGRAIDKGQTLLQSSIFDLLKEEKSSLEVLRIEVRLSRRAKLKTLLSKIKFESELTFKGVFQKNLWKRILQLYWQGLVTDNNLFLFEPATNPQQFLKRIMKTRPTTKSKQAIYLVGLQLLSKDKGVRELRKALGVSSRSWHRITKDFQILNMAHTPETAHEFLAQITESLEQLQSLRLPASIMSKIC